MSKEHFLPFNYISWLNRARTDLNPTLSQKLISIIQELENVHSLDELSAKLKQSITTLKNSSSYPLSLLSQLDQWNKDAEQKIKLHQSATEILDTLTSTIRTAPLIHLVQDLLINPEALLHIQAHSFLRALCTDYLPEFMSYLTTLESKPEPQNPRQGSFAAIRQSLPDQNSDYALCIALLNDITTDYDESNLLQKLGNDLLQPMLIIYMHVKQAKTKTLEPEGNHCVLI